MGPHRIRVLCVDDHPLVREGIESMIRAHQDLELVGAAATGEEALRLVAEVHPDVVLMDLQLPGMSGLEVISAIRADEAGPHIVVLTMYERDEDIARALSAGASTYLLKDVSCDGLAHVIRQVFAGEPSPLPLEVKRHLDGRGHTKLTARELEVIQLMAGGMRNRDIAIKLGIGEETAKMHVHNVLSKLHAVNRSAAILTAVRSGIIHIE